MLLRGPMYFIDDHKARRRAPRYAGRCFAKDALSRGCATRSPQAKRGGAKGDRTPDLGIANAALSQLSYRPDRKLF